ncbi:MAG: KEOPS complex subunit Cgi121 [Candidatus Micrarchaeia archaeon]
MPFDIAKETRKHFILKITIPHVPLEELISISKRASERGIFIQFFDPSAIKSREQLLFAYACAKIAFHERTNKYDNFAVEVMCFAAYEQQANAAIAKCGAKENSEVLVFADSDKALEMLKGKLSGVHEFKRVNGKSSSIEIARMATLHLQ